MNVQFVLYLSVGGWRREICIPRDVRAMRTDTIEHCSGEAYQKSVRIMIMVIIESTLRGKTNRQTHGSRGTDREKERERGK